MSADQKKEMPKEDKDPGALARASFFDFMWSVTSDDLSNKQWVENVLEVPLQFNYMYKVGVKSMLFNPPPRSHAICTLNLEGSVLGRFLGGRQRDTLRVFKLEQEQTTYSFPDVEYTAFTDTYLSRIRLSLRPLFTPDVLVSLVRPTQVVFNLHFFAITRGYASQFVNNPLNRIKGLQQYQKPKEIQPAAAPKKTQQKQRTDESKERKPRQSDQYGGGSRSGGRRSRSTTTKEQQSSSEHQSNKVESRSAASLPKSPAKRSGTEQEYWKLGGGEKRPKKN